MCKQVIAKYDTERAGCGVYRIQAYRYLHSLGQIYRIAVCHVNAEAFFQGRSSIWEAVFDDKVLRFLCIDKRCNVCFLSGNDRLHLFYTKCFQICCDLLTRTRGDFINHGPRECNGFLIAYICHEIVIHKTGFLPLFCHSQNRFAQFCTVLGAVVHGNESNRIFSCFITGQQHRNENCHCAGRFVRSIFDICFNEREPGSVCLLQSVALFRNGEGNHLQRLACKNFLQTVPLCRIRGLCLYCLCECTEHLVLTCSIAMKNNVQSQIIIWFVDFVHNIIIKRFHAGNASVQNAFL